MINATDLGTARGTAAANLAFEGADAEQARWWVRGLEVFDPEILESVPEPISGTTLPEILEALTGGRLYCEMVDELLDLYADAFRLAYERQAVAVCIDILRHGAA
jgi:hypothetical protein